MSLIPATALEDVKNYLLKLQEDLCARFEEIDTKNKFCKDQWQRNEGGGGLTRVLNEGQVFAKIGVNFSHVLGNELPLAASAERPKLKGYSFNAVGVSVVAHPVNPYVPTTHANVRFFMAEKAGEPTLWWFGGGIDLTPYYGFIEDCQHWHATAKKACEPFGEHIYPKFKNWCDVYFYLKHRNEPRGIGGLFFDDFSDDGFENSFALMQSIGNHFIEAYEPIVQRRKDHPFNAKHQAFQHYRRGRYVEFNLIYDRGTLFGLQSGGRVESILMSLPPEVSWIYDWKAEPGSEEERLCSYFLKPRDWLNIR